MNLGIFGQSTETFIGYIPNFCFGYNSNGDEYSFSVEGDTIKEKLCLNQGEGSLQCKEYISLNGKLKAFQTFIKQGQNTWNIYEVAATIAACTASIGFSSLALHSAHKAWKIHQQKAQGNLKYETLKAVAYLVTSVLSGTFAGLSILNNTFPKETIHYINHS